MVVDDEALNIEVIKSMLHEKGFECDSAWSGSQALEKIKSRHSLVQQGKAKMYKLILMDYSLPDMEGPDVAKQARSFIRKNLSTALDRLDPVICCCTSYTAPVYMR